MGFDTWVRARYRREIVMPPGFHIHPGTLIASNHQRDIDGPLLGTVIVARRGLHFQHPLPFYATREDLFETGILARLDVAWPRPLRAVLQHVSLGWFFPIGRAEPMRRLREFTLHDALAALLATDHGADDCAQHLNARGLRELGAHAGTTLRDAAARGDPTRLAAWWGLRRLRVAALEALAPGFRATVAMQLAGFTQRLDAGRCVYFAPEGAISTDGHFSRVRGGFRRLCRNARVPPWIQPMAIGYDSLAPGRMRVVVRIGAAFRADAAAPRSDFDSQLRHAVVSLVPITPSHLLARWLLHGPRRFTAEAFATWFARSHAALVANAVSIDPLFARASPARIARARLRWLERTGLAVREGATFDNACVRDAAPGWSSPAAIARYLDNGLADTVPDAASWLRC